MCLLLFFSPQMFLLQEPKLKQSKLLMYFCVRLLGDEQTLDNLGLCKSIVRPQVAGSPLTSQHATSYNLH